MRTFLKGFGNSAEDLARLEELSNTLEAQKTSLEQLTGGTAETIAQLQQFAAIAERLASTERRLSAVESMATQLDLAEGKLAGLASSQLRLEARLAESSSAIDRLRDEVAALGETAATASATAASVTERINESAARLDDLANAAGRIGEDSEAVAALREQVAAQDRRVDAVEQQTAKAADRLETFADLRPALDGAAEDLAAATAAGEANRAELEALRQELKELKAARQQQQAAAEDPAQRTMLEGRDRQISLLERRLAHADSLLADLRTSLQALVAQKVQVDHLLERASAIPMETRRVEALLDALRDERRASDRLCLALSELRHKQGQPAADPDPAATVG